MSYSIRFSVSVCIFIYYFSNLSVALSCSSLKSKDPKGYNSSSNSSSFMRQEAGKFESVGNLLAIENRLVSVSSSESEFDGSNDPFAI